MQKPVTIPKMVLYNFLYSHLELQEEITENNDIMWSRNGMAHNSFVVRTTFKCGTAVTMASMLNAVGDL